MKTILPTNPTERLWEENMNTHREKLLEFAVHEKRRVYISEFYLLLTKHNWLYAASEDESVVQCGQLNFNRLNAIKELNPEFEEMFRSFEEYIFSGGRLTGRSDAKLRKPIPPQSDTFVEIEMPVVDGTKVLLKPGDERGHGIWQDTKHLDGPFLLREIEGRKRPVGVFGDYRDVLGAAYSSVSYSTGRYEDVLIENIKIYETAEHFAYQ